MKVALTLAALLLTATSFANVKFSYSNEELTKIIDDYSKATGQKFIVDPGVRGRATISGADNVPTDEAFSLLSSALATNGFAISKRDDTMVVKSARHIQRDLIETTTSLPSLKPERMVTYVYTFKHIPASSVMRDLRILSSKDGETSVYDRQNQIIITDWTSNLHRVDMIFKQLDRPTDPKLAKLVSESKKEREKSRRHGQKMEMKSVLKNSQDQVKSEEKNPTN